MPQDNRKKNKSTQHRRVSSTTPLVRREGNRPSTSRATQRRTFSPTPPLVRRQGNRLVNTTNNKANTRRRNRGNIRSRHSRR